jgi:hypothetical protein
MRRRRPHVLRDIDGTAAEAKVIIADGYSVSEGRTQTPSSMPTAWTE